MPSEFKEWMPTPLPLDKREVQNWRVRLEQKHSVGEILLDLADPYQKILTPEQHRKILMLNTETAVAELLQTDLGDTVNPNIQKAYETFGELAKQEIEIPRLLLTLRFYTMFQCMLVIEDNRMLVKDRKLMGAERVSAHKASLEAVARMDALLTVTTRLAKEFAKLAGKAQKPKPAPVTGSAPELD